MSQLQGTGTLWNLSLDGCRIDGNLSVLRGDAVELLCSCQANGLDSREGGGSHVGRAVESVDSVS